MEVSNEAFALTAKLSSSAFFAGEFLFCQVAVRPSHHFFHLSAEVHGICRRDSKWVKDMSAGEVVRSKAAIDLGFGKAQNESCVLECAQPTVLACEVASTIPADGVVLNYLFYVQLPFDLVPSFRGTAFQYFYFASISLSVGQSGHEVLKVPFRVLRKSRIDSINDLSQGMEPLKLGRSLGCITLCHPDDVFGFVELVDDVARGRVELARAAQEEFGGTEWALLIPPHHSPLLKEMDYVRTSSEERSAKFFERAHAQGRVFAIQSKQHVVVDWKLDASCFMLGDCVRGVLDFSRGQVACYRVHMALLRREVVKAQQLALSKKDLELDYVVDELDRDSFNAITLPVSFHLTRDHAQTFSTKSFAVRWIIKFVFYCAKQPMKVQFDEEVHARAVVDESELDRIEWELEVPFVVVGPELPRHLAGEPLGVGVVL